MGEDRAIKNGRISDFQGLMTLTLTLDRVTAYRHASVIDLYLHTKFHWNQRNFLWTATYCHLQNHTTQKL